VPPGALYDGTLRIKHKGQGINQMARIGTFAEEVVVPEEMVVPIRKDMPWPQAALVGCCVATGVGAVTRHAKIEAGSMVLVIGLLFIGTNHFADGLNPLVVGSLIMAIGLSLGGPTGFAINPARDLAPRLAHYILPIAGKGGSDWRYAWVPVVGPIVGALLGVGLPRTFRP